MTTVMGLDLSLSNTGIVVVESGHLKMRRSVGTDPKFPLIERISAIEGEIRIAWMGFQPDLTVIEDYAYVRFSRALTPLAELGGAVKLSLHHMDAPYIEINNTTVKLFASGKPRPSKQEMLALAQAKEPKIHNDDEADAYFLAMYGYENYEELVEDAGQ